MPLTIRRRFESGSDPLLEFEFDLVNFGDRPEIVTNVVAFMFLSNGPGTRSEDSPTRLPVSQGQEICGSFWGDRPSVRIFPPGPLNDIDPVSGAAAYALPGGTIVLTRGKRSKKFTQFVRDARSPDAKLYNIWIIGTVSYERSHRRHLQNSLLLAWRERRERISHAVYTTNAHSQIFHDVARP